MHVLKHGISYLCNVKIPSVYLKQVVDQLAMLPGVGRRTALRLALYILKKKPEEREQFAQAFLDLNTHIRTCDSCGNVSDLPECAICANPRRDHGLVCVVEDVRDIMAIEETNSFTGVYHVLGGIISPMDGIGPSDLNIQMLLDKINAGGITEVIFALSATMEGDTTNFYLFKKIKPSGIKVTTLSRGVSVGTELHYADGLTLGRSIVNRTLFEAGQ